MTVRLFKLSRGPIAALLSLLLLIPSGLLPAAQTAPGDEAAGHAWKFRVYLDEKEIGYHHFYLAESGTTRQLTSVASFEYRLLLVPLFSYEHRNKEIWNGNCLQSIESRTDSNGKPYSVDGRRSAGEFRVATREGEQSLPECVMSFAYWNPSFLGQTALLNTQDGEFQQVDVSEPVFDEFPVNGELRPSYRYSLVAGGLTLDLWYSPQQQWLGLESEVRGGRKLRYELEDGSEPRFSVSGDVPVTSLAGSRTANGGAGG